MGSINIFKPMSTFLYAWHLINLHIIDNFFLGIKMVMLRITPKAAEPIIKYANHCAMLPLFCLTEI